MRFLAANVKRPFFARSGWTEDEWGTTETAGRHISRIVFGSNLERDFRISRSTAFASLRQFGREILASVRARLTCAFACGARPIHSMATSKTARTNPAPFVA